MVLMGDVIVLMIPKRCEAVGNGLSVATAVMTRNERRGMTDNGKASMSNKKKLL